MDQEQESESFWTTLPGVLTASAAAITAVATLIGTLAAVGVFEGSSEPTPSSTTPGPEPSLTTQPQSPTTLVPVTTTKPAQPEVPVTGSIELVYDGDPYGCILQLTVDIAGNSFVPVGSRDTLDGIPLGEQEYMISGSISCPTIGNCFAVGDGRISVTNGAIFNVFWENTDVNRCEVVLS